MPTFQGENGYDDEMTIILNSVELGNCSQPQGLNPIDQNYNWRASQGDSTYRTKVFRLIDNKLPLPKKSKIQIFL
jgi:hypothetical protein